jgi:hypothetical protein
MKKHKSRHPWAMEQSACAREKLAKPKNKPVKKENKR